MYSIKIAIIIQFSNGFGDGANASLSTFDHLIRSPLSAAAW